MAETTIDGSIDWRCVLNTCQIILRDLNSMTDGLEAACGAVSADSAVWYLNLCKLELVNCSRLARAMLLFPDALRGYSLGRNPESITARINYVLSEYEKSSL